MNDKINELNKTTVDVIKNKLASPFGVAKFAIEWGTGIDKLGEIIDYAVDFDIIKKGGAWFTYGDSKFQGTDKLKNFLEENSDILLDIESQVIALLNNEVPVEEIEVVEEEEEVTVCVDPNLKDDE